MISSVVEPSRNERYPDRCAGLVRPSADTNIAVQGCHHALSNDVGGVLIEIEAEKGELVAPDPRQQIARPDRGLKPPGDRLEDTVTDGVAVVVIDPLETRPQV